MARIPFVRHRTVNQIANKYRACRHPVEKVRWHAIWLLARTDEPRTPAQVADLVGLSDVTVRQVLHRWNADGPAGLIDQRQHNRSDSKLTARRRAALLTALQKRPPRRGGVDRAEGGSIRGRPLGGERRSDHRVALAAGSGVHPPSAAAVASAGGGSTDPPAVEKNLRRRVRRLKAAHPGTPVELWAEDEARLGLKPITRLVINSTEGSAFNTTKGSA